MTDRKATPAILTPGPINLVSRRRPMILGAGALFAGVFGLLVATDPVQLGALLFAPAVILVGLEMGAMAGAIAGLGATALFVLSGAVRGVDIRPITVAPRGLSLLVVGYVTGILAQRLVSSTEDARAIQAQLTQREASLRALFASALDAIVIVDGERRFIEGNPAVAEVLGLPAETIIGRPMDDFSTLAATPALLQAWDQLLATGRVRGEYEFVTGEGPPRRLEFSASANFQPGRHLLMLRDASERLQHQEALQRRVAQNLAIADLGLDALGTGSLQGLLERTVSQIARTVDADYVAVWRLDSDRGELELVCAAGWPADMVGSLRVKDSPDQQVGYALRADEPVLIQELSAEKRFQPLPFLLSEGVRSGISVAIGGGEGRWGTVAVHTRDRRAFDRDHLHFMRVVSNTLAMAVERDRVLEELHLRGREVARLASDRQQIVARALNAEDEARQRISQFLHDEVLQDLLTVKQDLAQANETVEEPATYLRHAQQNLQRTIGDLRAAVFDLRPMALEHAGLASALKTVADYQSQRGKFSFSLDVGDVSGSGRDELLFSLARELLTNVARHAHARHADIRVTSDGVSVVLEVADDGLGMDPGRPAQAVREGHIGLASAAQRVEALGGAFEVDSAPGKGTRVRTVLPLQSPFVAPRGRTAARRPQRASHRPSS